MKKRSLFGWLELLSGIGMILLAIVAFTTPEGKFAFLYAAVALVTGITDIVFYIKTERYTGVGPVIALICGVFSILVGTVLLAYPNSQLDIRSHILFPLWFGSHCIFRLVNLNVQKEVAGKASSRISLTISVLGLIFVAVLLLKPSFLEKAGIASGCYLLAAGADSVAMGLSRIGSKW